MAQGFPVSFPPRLFDADGLPADGWKVYTYEAGTTTALATYEDATLLSANTNPVIADASGYVRLFVAVGVLIKIVVKDADDALQFTLDNLEPMPDTSTSAGSVTAVPTGGILDFGGTSAPTGFLLCDGSAVNRGTYAALFAVIGTAYGAGDGTTTFTLPDYRGRFALGKAASGTGATLGESGGAIDHTHTGPSHTHGVTVTRDGWGSTTTSPNVAGRILTGLGAGGSNDQAANDLAVTSAAGGTGATGTANPPYVTANRIIKT